jgi:hypothetical protein
VQPLILLALLTAYSSVSEDWLAIRIVFTDNVCTTAHDRVSGARVIDCTDDNGYEDPQSSDRFVSERLISENGAEIRVLEYRDPDRDLDRFRADLSDDSSDCWIEEYLRALRVPDACTRQFVYVVRKPGGLTRQYNAKVCSTEQQRRSLEYVRRLTRGGDPALVSREENGPTQSIPLSDAETKLPTMTLEQVLRAYGSPWQVWPRYPDAVSLLYPSLGDPRKDVVIHLNRKRAVIRVSVLCSGSP